MARYEGMDELLQRVQERLTESDVAPERSEPDMRLPATIPRAADQYTNVVEKIVLLRRDAQELRDLLTADRVHALTLTEHEDVLRLLGELLQELRSCEAALQRAAPVE